MKQFVAMGGSSPDPANPLLERYILRLTNQQHPRVCFLGQASAESAEYTVKFYEVFTRMGAIPSHLSLFGRVPQGWQEHLLAQDVIYVGGGNTRSMLALWREWGVDEVLAQAAERGTLLAGVSAGMICWFEQAVTDSVWPLGIIRGLGFLPGSACPHYDAEPERRPTYIRMIEDGIAMPGLALQNAVAAHFVDGELHEVVSAKRGSQGFYVSVQDGAVTESPLQTRFLGDLL